MNAKIEYRDGLIYTSIELINQNSIVIVDNVIIDTGAFHTIIATDFLDELGAEFSNEDKLIEATGYGGATSYAVRKKIDGIVCNEIKINNFKIDFGEIDPNERINGLLGLDFLMKSELVIDLGNLVMYNQS